MTSRQARRERREAERKAKKAELKRTKAETAELGFVSHTAPFSASLNRSPEQSDGLETRFVSQNRAPASKRALINRLNAVHSTGPKTPNGKLASSRNSLKHGLASGELIIPGENPDAFEALLRNLIEEHQPANTTEELLVTEMAQSWWLAQRAIRLQNDCFSQNGIDEKRLSLFLRYQTTYERAFHKALNTLLRAQKERRKTKIGFVSQTGDSSASPTRSSEQSDGFDSGFVSQTITPNVKQ